MYKSREQLLGELAELHTQHAKAVQEWKSMGGKNPKARRLSRQIKAVERRIEGTNELPAGWGIIAGKGGVTTESPEGSAIAKPQIDERNSAAMTRLLIKESELVKNQLAMLRPLNQENQIVVIQALLNNARSELAHATLAQDLPALAELKTTALAAFTVTRELKLPREMWLETTEFIRRAERALGVAIRHGQEHGTVLKRGQHSQLNRNQWASAEPSTSALLKPSDFATISQLTPGGAQTGIYGLVDGVSDEVFEQAIKNARAADKLVSLSRASLARECRLVADPSLREPEPEPPPRKVRKTAAGRKVMNDILVQVGSLAFVVSDTDPEEIDYPKHKREVEEIFRDMAVIRRFLTAVKEQ